MACDREEPPKNQSREGIMSPDMWAVVGIQGAIAIATLVALVKFSAMTTEAITIMRSVDRRLGEDSKEHVKIVERLSVLDDDVKELRREMR